MRLAVTAAAVCLPLLAAACAPFADRGADPHGVDTLGGVLVVPAGDALPPTARGEVRLVDLTRSEPGRPFLVASQVIDGPLTAPVPYRLQWRPMTLEPGHEYALAGRVFTEARTLYRSETPVPVAEGSGDRTVPLTLAAVPAPPEDAERKRYSLDSMPDVQKLRELPQGEPLRRDDTYYGLGTDPLPSDPLDSGRVILPGERVE
ncbi:YbaY family lipoprotein [Caenispirillum bisanense]|uniref:Uncharacterized lipoprotein YbaY n=1 Tax=Caenispirillum bisanense TaxID=414052 RepID=A0A286GLD0_9PROT|nr:YbaY family lipoprotein [Caenispirillum bisanense]SOD95899.1 Uncharacterized lipoprotein YbaY [Caenispirillum bisanense]